MLAVPSPLKTRLIPILGILAAILAGLAAWAYELHTSATSLGLFTWLSPPLLLAIWIGFSSRKDIRADLLALARVFALLVIAWIATPLFNGMRPLYASCFASAAILLAVLAPLIVGLRFASNALRCRLGSRPRARIMAFALAQLLPTLLWTPVFTLALATHRAHATLDPKDIDISWPSEPVTFAGASGTRLEGLWFPNPKARGAVLLLHGIGAEKAEFLPSVEALYRAGYHVFTVDQRGHGESGGLTTTLGLVEAEDAIRAWDVLRDLTRGEQIPRIAMGISMGSMAARLAAPRLQGLDGLILDSSFADVGHVAVRVLPLGPLRQPALFVARLFAIPLTGHPVLTTPAPVVAPGVPVLLLHCRRDPFIPFTEAEILARAYGSLATLVALKGDRHAGGVFTDPIVYAAATERFASSLQAKR